MVKSAPVNIECRLFQTLDMSTHLIFIGEIVASHCDEEVMTDDVIDLEKVRPMLFDMMRKQYWKLGPPFAKCWSVGKELKR